MCILSITNLFLHFTSMTLNMVGICRGDRVGKAINSRRVNSEHTTKRCIYKYAIANEWLTDSKLMAKGQILIVGYPLEGKIRRR